MLRVYFADLSDGRLNRLGYLAYWLGLVLFVIVISVAAGLAIGLYEQTTGGGFPPTQDELVAQVGQPAMILFALVGVVLVFVSLNLQAKRLRDMGLPGWPVAAILVGINLAVSATLSEGAGAVLSGIVFLALVLIPSNTFARSSTMAG